MLYFVDESGIDLKEAPFSVLAAVGLSESSTWAFSQAFSDLKSRILRVPDAGEYEVKGVKLLKRRVFRQAASIDALSDDDRAAAIEELYENNREGRAVSAYQLGALAQGKLLFVQRALSLAADYGVTVFGSMVPRDAPQQRDGSILRKDFAYLFQRMHCDVVDRAPEEQGILVFDEQDPALCKQLLVQMDRYFVGTANGRLRSERLIPLPFFVRSDLTPPVQLADVIAYILNWGFRLERMPESVREELVPYANQVFGLRYSGREVLLQGRQSGTSIRRSRTRGNRIWGIAYIPDLRPRSEHAEEDEASQA